MSASPPADIPLLRPWPQVEETFPQDPLPEIHPSLLEGTPKPKPADERRQGGAGGSRSVGGGGGSEGVRNGPEVVDIGIAMVQLGGDGVGGDDDEEESADGVDGRETENADAASASASAAVADEGVAGRGEEGGASSPPPPPGDEGSENGGGAACEGDGDDEQQQVRVRACVYRDGHEAVGRVVFVFAAVDTMPAVRNNSASHFNFRSCHNMAIFE